MSFCCFPPSGRRKDSLWGGTGPYKATKRTRPTFAVDEPLQLTPLDQLHEEVERGVVLGLREEAADERRVHLEQELLLGLQAALLPHLFDSLPIQDFHLPHAKIFAHVRFCGQM